MTKLVTIVSFLSMFIFQLAVADRCQVVDDNFDFGGTRGVTNISAYLNGPSIVIIANDGSGLEQANFSGQLTYEQFNSLQDERLKAAIIRSLNSNSSWQQR